MLLDWSVGMPKDGSATKSRILDSAEQLILGQGFAATSIDSVADKAGITKGTFFYHFPDKASLALALVERFAALDRAELEEGLTKVRSVTRDPLQQLLHLVAGFEEKVAELAEASPGCLFASYIYEAQLFEQNTLAVIEKSYLTWRRTIGEMLRQAAEKYPPRLEVNLDDLADQLTVIFEGAFILTRTLHDRRIMPAQLRHWRNYLELLFGVV